MPVLASYEANGEIFTATIQDVAYAAWQAVTSGLSMAVLLNYVNPAIIEAEASQPEGTLMEMEIHGWTNPITGTDYSQRVADWLNGQWAAGNVTGTEGTPITPWPDYPDQVAWGGGDTVVLRWVKGQIGGPFLLLYLVAGLVALAIILNWIGNFLKPWSLSASGKQPSWWDRLSTWEKMFILGGTMIIGLFAVWLLAEQSIARAGASQIIITRE